MADAGLLSDEDVGLGTPAPPATSPSAPPTPASVAGGYSVSLTPDDAPTNPAAATNAGGLLSDADLGITPNAGAKPLTNNGDEGYFSSAAKNVATGAIKGAGDAVGYIGNMGKLAQYVGDRGEQGVRYLAGAPKPFDQIEADNAALRQRIGGLDAYPTGEQVAAPILAKTGSYEPDSYAGKLAQAGIETAVGSLGPGGGNLGAGLTKNALVGSLAKQAPVTAASGMAGQAVTDGTGDPLLGLAAGASAGTISHGTAAGVNKVVEPFAEKLPGVGAFYAGTQDRLAGQKLLGAAQDPAAFQNKLSPGPMQPGADSPIPGFTPTTAQLTGDAGVAQAERGDATVNPAPYVARRDAQNLAVSQNIDAMTPTGSPQAVVAHLQDRLGAMDSDADTQIGLAQKMAQDHAAGIGTGAGPEVTGDDLRVHVALANQAATQNARELWKAVDPDGTLANSMAPIKQASESIYGGLTDTAKQFVNPEEQKFADLISGYRAVEPFQQLADLRSNLASSMRQERAANGSTPAYARMSRLMDTAQSTINNAIEGRAAQEAHAVQQGTMSPEDTMVSRVLDWQRTYYDGQQAQGLLSGTGGNAGAGPTAFSGVSGAKGQSNQRFGNPSSDQGVSSPPLVPNYDEAAAGRLKAASQATKDIHQTFDNGVPGNLLASRGNAGDYKLSNSAVPAKVLPGGPKGYDAIKQYQKATGNSPEANVSLQNAFSESVRAKTIGADGMVDPKKLEQWKTLHQHGLRAMDETEPGFSKRFDDAGKATSTVMAETVAQKAMRDHFQQGIVGKLLGADGEDEIINRFGRIMNADDRVAQINKLMAATAGNPDARDGVRKTAAAWMARQFKTQTEIGSTGEKQVSANAFKKIVADKAPVLAKIFSIDEMGGFHKIAGALDMQNRSITSKIAGSPGTAQDVHQAAKGHGHAGPSSSIGEAAKSGAMLGWMAHGLHGAAYGAATGAVGHIVKTLRAMGVDNVNKLYTDALLNPERARYYLSKVPPHNDRAVAQSMAASLRRSFLTAPQMVQSVAPARASGGKVEKRLIYVPPREDDISHALAIAYGR